MPTWAIGEPIPSGAGITVMPTKRTFDRTGNVDATMRITNRTGRSTTLPVTARTESVWPTADPVVVPGRYHLRAMVDVRLSTAPNEITRTIAAPPVEVALR